MGETNTTELYTHYGTARRVFEWTAIEAREEPFALGRATVELADYADAIARLASGYADEGLAIRLEEHAPAAQSPGGDQRPVE